MKQRGTTKSPAATIRLITTDYYPLLRGVTQRIPSILTGTSFVCHFVIRQSVSLIAAA